MTAAPICCPHCGCEILTRQTDGLAKPVAGLTAKQARLLQFIHGYTVEHGCSPSYEEMGAHLGLTSKGPVFRLVQCLQERGYVTRIRSHARSIILERAAISFVNAMRPRPPNDARAAA